MQTLWFYPPLEPSKPISESPDASSIIRKAKGDQVPAGYRNIYATALLPYLPIQAGSAMVVWLKGEVDAIDSVSLHTGLRGFWDSVQVCDFASVEGRLEYVEALRANWMRRKFWKVGGIEGVKLEELAIEIVLGLVKKRARENYWKWGLEAGRVMGHEKNV